MLRLVLPVALMVASPMAQAPPTRTSPDTPPRLTLAFTLRVQWGRRPSSGRSHAAGGA